MGEQLMINSISTGPNGMGKRPHMECPLTALIKGGMGPAQAPDPMVQEPGIQHRPETPAMNSSYSADANKSGLCCGVKRIVLPLGTKCAVYIKFDLI